MMLAKRVYPVALLTVLVTSSVVKRDATDKAPLLTAISKDPDLSIFYSLFNSTGAPSGIPGPPFEERFNNLTDGRKFTAFAPINSAFKGLHPELIAALTAPASYSLLEAILRTHIGEGSFTTEDVRTQDKSVTPIEGMPLKFRTSGDTITINNQSKLVSASRTVVGNGAIFKIASVIDPLMDIFGTDVDRNAPASAGQANRIPKEESQKSGTVASALASLPNLSTYLELLKATSPEFLSLLDAPLPNGKTISIFAPSNGVFKAIGGTARILQPSNQPLTSYLLKYPFIDTTSAGREKSMAGFPATVRRDGTGAITSVNNAAVKGEKICVCNACVYTVDRWLDPVFGLF